MANFSEINLAREMIPNYEGDSKNLSYFIQQCEKFILNYKKDENLVENNTFNKLLFEICCSKLIGNARDVLVISNCVTWTEVKNALISMFGDARNETLLENDLTICYQLSNQTYDEYYEVIKSKLQQLLEHLTIKEANLELKVFKTDLYNSKALETFKAGLLEPHRSFISYQTVTSLEDCILQLRNYDNHKQQVNFLNFIRQKPTNRNFVRNINTHNKPQFQKLTQPNHSFNNPNRFNSPNFNHNFYKTNQFNSNPNYKNTHNNFPTFPNATNTSSDVQIRQLVIMFSTDESTEGEKRKRSDKREGEDEEEASNRSNKTIKTPIKSQQKREDKLDKILIMYQQLTLQEKTEIMKNKVKLARHKDDKVYINNDMTRQERDIEKQIRKRAEEKRKQGKKVNGGYQKLYIDKQVWKWNKEKSDLEEVVNSEAKINKNTKN
ncbi:hypothetical protein FQA39_LY10740 [Lamprigera yunnana]|nr:hypothetical protein FQA39_LY10740 [Lamprigera yunnana]